MADEAADGLEALNAISKTHYQLVLLDLRMPGMDGLQVLTHIRSMPAAAALPVIVLSATRADDVVRSAVSLGIVDFFVKPLTKEIIDRLGRHLTRQAA
jgi:two-component system cell cycle response regulator